jgi:transposase-like protein
MAYHTVTNWINCFKHLIMWGMDDDRDEKKIGGFQIEVQVDECKFGKRKYNCGHRVLGHWVLGGIENTEEKKVFAVVIPNKKAETLIDLISRHVHRGSIIKTDCWKGYRDEDFVKFDMAHDTVNHTYHFVDPFTVRGAPLPASISSVFSRVFLAMALPS